MSLTVFWQSQVCERTRIVSISGRVFEDQGMNNIDCEMIAELKGSREEFELGFVV